MLFICQQLPEYAHLLTEALVNDHLIVHVSTGFGDTAPLLREMTVKAVLPLAPKLNDKSWTTLV